MEEPVISGYTLLIGIGLLIGALLVCLTARRRGFGVTPALDGALLAAAGGMLGARFAYLIRHWDYYRCHLNLAMRIRDGGLAWHGGLIGGLLAVISYCVVQRISLAAMLDLLAPGIASLAVGAWLGCFMANCAYGVETYPGQGLLWRLSLDLPDLYGIRAPRVAVQLLGATWSGVVLIVMLIIGQRKRFAGLAFPLWVSLYCFGAFWLGFARADEVRRIAGWRADQLVDAALFVVGAVSLIVGRFREKVCDDRN